jgi:hypothetical protein
MFLEMAENNLRAATVFTDLVDHVTGKGGVIYLRPTGTMNGAVLEAVKKNTYRPRKALRLASTNCPQRRNPTRV